MACGDAVNALLARFAHSTFRGQALAVWSMLVAWRTRTHRDVVQLLEHAFAVCVECGDIVYASMCVQNYAWSRFAASPSLVVYLGDMERWLTFALASQLTQLVPQCTTMMQVVVGINMNTFFKIQYLKVARALLNRTADECSLDQVGGEAPFSESDYVRDFGANYLNMAPFYIFKVLKKYLLLDDLFFLA